MAGERYEQENQGSEKVKRHERQACYQQAGLRPVSYTHLDVYKRQIRYCSKVHGKVNAEVEEHIKQQLIAALFKFRFDR